tara:strand:- start:2610 stop:2996 length:387 start_codon:yes stop_codon:yes gene_type:complete
MDLIIKDKTFDVDLIDLKTGKNSKKIIYDLGSLYLIGLSFKIENYRIVNQSKKFLFIDTTESPQLEILLTINEYFKNNNKPYRSYINDNIIEIKKHNYNTIHKGDELFISINNIKMIKSYFNVQLFTI